MWVQKCFGNEIEPFASVLATRGLELWLQKQSMLRTSLKKSGVCCGQCTTICFLLLPHSQFSTKIYICHVYSNGELTTYTKMLRPTFNSSDIYMQSSAAFRCRTKSLRKMDNCTFREYADRHLILSRDCGNNAAAVCTQTSILIVDSWTFDSHHWS